MFRKSRTISFKDDELPPKEQVAVAGSQFQALNRQAQQEMENMYRSVPSSFSVAAKSCETERTAFLQCFTRHSGADINAAPNSAAVAPAQLENRWSASASEIHKCYPDIHAYEKCFENILVAHKETLDAILSKNASAAAATAST